MKRGSIFLVYCERERSALQGQWSFSGVALVVMSLLITVSCTSDRQEETTTAPSSRAQQFVDEAIAAMNGGILDSAHITFRLRDRDYIYKKRGGRFEYTRIYFDREKNERIVDVLTNDGLVRTINNQEVDLTAERRQAFTNSVNGVIYFAFLPYRLNDPAVIKEYLGLQRIRNREYRTVRVTFEEEGGGVDYQDTFLFWFDVTDASMDYFAYDYITDGGGVRFREAIGRRSVGGVVIQDYYNYTKEDLPIDSLASAFDRGQLELLSTIRLESVQLHSDEGPLETVAPATN